MEVKLIPIKDGRKCALFALGLGKRCAVFSFLERIAKSNVKESDKIWALIDDVKDNGPKRNVERCRKLADTDGIWELKTTQVRVLFFFDGASMIICTNGFLKKTRKTPAGEIDRAERLKRQYQSAKAAGTLKKG